MRREAEFFIPAYREFTSFDALDIAYHYNLNLGQLENLWCKKKPTTPEKIRLHALSFSLRGKSLTQVHRENNTFFSYFGGYVKKGTATFTIAVINLEIPDSKAVFRTDSAHALGLALSRGVEQVRLSGSSDDAWYARWAEDEVGMERLRQSSNIWIAQRDTVENYISSQKHWGTIEG